MFSHSRNLKRLKINIQFKHVRFKSANKDLKPQVKSSKEVSKLRIHNLAESFGCNFLTAREITTKNKNILALDHSEYYKNVTFCKSYLKLSDLVEYPYVLSLNSSLLQHRYFALKELGFSNVSACDLLKFPHILKKSPKILEEEGFTFTYDKSFDVLEKYLDSSDRKAINCKLQHMYSDGSNLWKIKEAMNAEFLAAKFGCPIGKAHQMLHSYPPLRVQSIVNTDQLLNILLEKFELSFSKICSSLNLLSLHPETVEDFILKVPGILGVNTIYIARKQPLVLRRPVDSIKKVEAILKDFNISEAQLMNCTKIIVFTPNTLKQRLTAICESKDFSVLKSYKKFLWLVYYYNNLNPRLEALKEMNVPCSINMFTVSKSNFSKYLCVQGCRKDINDICFYLANVFSICEEKILTALQAYPNYQKSSLINCQKVVNFLLQSGVTKKQMFNGLGIIFYDFDVVKVYFDDLKNHPECQPFEEWTSHYNLIQLLIYAIEVDTGFLGSRVYKTKCKMDDEEELLMDCSSN